MDIGKATIHLLPENLKYCHFERNHDNHRDEKEIMSLV
jgi:hypothetical protein